MVEIYLHVKQLGQDKDHTNGEFASVAVAVGFLRRFERFDGADEAVVQRLLVLTPIQQPLAHLGHFLLQRPHDFLDLVRFQFQLKP
jgi:hypothetical protein